MQSYTEESPLEKIAKEEFWSMARHTRDLFMTENGKVVLDFLKKRYYDSFFDSNHPGERALDQQGQISVISDMQTIIDNVNKGFL